MVETAIALSIFVLLLLAMIEITRLGMASQLLTHAAREGCRVAVIDGKVKTDVDSTVRGILNGGGITTYTSAIATGSSPATTDITNTVLGDSITLTLTVRFSNVGWLSTPLFLGSASISTSATMSSERP